MKGPILVNGESMLRSRTWFVAQNEIDSVNRELNSVITARCAYTYTCRLVDYRATRVGFVIYVIRAGSILWRHNGLACLRGRDGMANNTRKLGRKEAVFNSFRRKLIPANYGASARAPYNFLFSPVINYFTASRDAATAFPINRRNFDALLLHIVASLFVAW